MNAPLVYNGDVASYACAPDGERVLYLADQEVDGANELFETLFTRYDPRGPR